MYLSESLAACSRASSVNLTLWWASYLSLRPFKISIVSFTVGGSTIMVWNLRSKAASFSMYLRYSSKVVAPIHWVSPRESAGFKIFEASIAPSAPPAPTKVCNSSINITIFSAFFISSITALIRSSNCPRYLVPATIKAKSIMIIRLSLSGSGILPATIC